MYMHSGRRHIDEVTVDNVNDSQMPLANNGPTSFWSPAIARRMYSQAGLNLITVDRYGRTYDSGRLYVEYLAIVGSKPNQTR